MGAIQLIWAKQRNKASHFLKMVALKRAVVG